MLELLLTTTYTLFFIFIIHRMKFFEIEGISKRTLSVLFVLKILFGVMLWGIYTFYYTDRSTADIYKYFDDSKIIFDSLKQHPQHFFRMLLGIYNNTPEFQPYYEQMNYWARKIDGSIYNDSHTIIRFNAFVRIFSLGYYNVHTVFICFLSFVGLTGIYRTFFAVLKDKKQELLFAVYLLPSVLFWGSGVLKEGLILFALGLVIHYTNRLFNAKAIVICFVMALLLALSKFYVWLAIVPSLLLLIWTNKSGNSKSVLKYLLIVFVIALVGLNIDRFTSVQNPLVTLSQKQIEFKQLAQGNFTDAYHKPIPIAGSMIVIDTLEPTLSSLVKNSPKALLNTFFRPYPWEVKSPLMLLAGGENIIILLFILLCIVYHKPLSTVHWEYVLFCVSFVIIQFVIIGETTPVIGAIARYKVPALPFLLISFLFILDKDKMLKGFPFMKKLLSQ